MKWGPAMTDYDPDGKKLPQMGVVFLSGLIVWGASLVFLAVMG